VTSRRSTSRNDDKWAFALPESGGTLWADNMLVPIGSPHKKNAETLMSYYYDPKVAAEVAAYVNYICPVEGAQAEMAKIDPELAKNQYIFPDAEFLAKAKQFRTLTPQEGDEVRVGLPDGPGQLRWTTSRRAAPEPTCG
jgi:spermidine/putrescine transport system substrate-binding protein